MAGTSARLAPHLGKGEMGGGARKGQGPVSSTQSHFTQDDRKTNLGCYVIFSCTSSIGGRGRLKPNVLHLWSFFQDIPERGMSFYTVVSPN